MYTILSRNNYDIMYITNTRQIALLKAAPNAMIRPILVSTHPSITTTPNVDRDTSDYGSDYHNYSLGFTPNIHLLTYTTSRMQ